MIRFLSTRETQGTHTHSIVKHSKLTFESMQILDARFVFMTKGLQISVGPQIKKIPLQPLVKIFSVKDIIKLECLLQLALKPLNLLILFTFVDRFCFDYGIIFSLLHCCFCILIYLINKSLR